MGGDLAQGVSTGVGEGSGLGDKSPCDGELRNYALQKTWERVM